MYVNTIVDWIKNEIDFYTDLGWKWQKFYTYIHCGEFFNDQVSWACWRVSLRYWHFWQNFKNQQKVILGHSMIMTRCYFWFSSPYIRIVGNYKYFDVLKLTFAYFWHFKNHYLYKGFIIFAMLHIFGIFKIVIFKRCYNRIYRSQYKCYKNAACAS